MPLVISKKPQIRGFIKEESTLIKLKKGEIVVYNIFKIPLDFRIESMLENNTTNPPIKRSVEILFVILNDKTSPKLENETYLDCDFKLEFKLLEEEFFFQNLNIIPTLKQDKMCVIKSNKPIVEFPNIKIPTVPIIKRGPELFVKLRSLSHSSLEQILFFLKFVAILAPTGYPLIIPIIKAKAPSPRTLNKGFIYLFKIFPKIFIIFVCIKSSVDTKNGKSDGTTDVAQRFIPDFIAKRFELENIIKDIVKNKKNIVNIFLLNLIM